MVHLQEMYEDYEEDGLVVLGFNCADKKKLACDLLRKKGVSFPNIIDTSKDARRVSSRAYRCSGVPLNYIIDRKGKIAAAFYGYRENDSRVTEALKKLGL